MSIKISQLPSASAVTSDDFIPIVDSGSITTQKATAAQLLEFITSSITELPNLITSSNPALIGEPEDGTYTDGLFADFVSTTTVGVAIDRINEVLKGLAPLSAPDLTNLEKESGPGATMRLSFGSSSPASGYTSVTASLAGLSNIDIGQTFQPINGAGGGLKRLGIFTEPVSLQLILNNTTVADSAAFINYPDNSFNVPPNGIEKYTLEVNGVVYGTPDETSDTGSFSGISFDLSPANPAAFIGTGIQFDLFRNRTGTATIDVAGWIIGHNYAKVIHSSSLGEFTTNYIDWVYDPEAVDTDLNYIFNDVTASSLTVNGLKTLSGVKYYTNVTYDFTTYVENYFRSCYPVASNGGVTFTTNPVSPSMTAASIIVGTPANNTSNLEVTSSQTIGNIRLLGQTLSTTINIANGLGKVGSDSFTTPTILLDKINTANTDLVENFCLENYRILSGVYDTQISVTSLSSYPSSSDLQNTELAVYNGAVMYPTQILNGGDVEGSSVTFKIASQPDYSTATEERFYFRKFINGSDSLAEFKLLITGKNITFVPASETLSGDEVKLFIKIPGKTGWRDVNTTAGDSSEDDIGCLQGDLALPIGAIQETRTIEINLLEQGIEPGEVYLLRIQTSSGWTGSISKVQIS
jgi:hypothetical protein